MLRALESSIQVDGSPPVIFPESRAPRRGHLSSAVRVLAFWILNAQNPRPQA